MSVLAFLRSPIMMKWLPLIIQTIALLGGGIAYALTQEHRLTIIEESIKTQKYIIEQQEKTQELMIEQLRDTQHTLDRLVTLEDFFHGGLTKDEAESYRRAKMKRDQQ